MADKLFFYPDSANLYAILRNLATGTVYDGTTTLATWDNADIADYDVPLASLGGDAYGLTLPANLPSGNYVAAIYVRAGATPALTDVKIPDEWEFETDEDEEEEEAADDMTTEAARAAILANALKPKRVRGDAGEVEQHSIADQLKALETVTEEETRATGTAGLGVRFVKLIPGNSD
jgi:hypothetical protein